MSWQYFISNINEQSGAQAQRIYSDTLPITREGVDQKIGKHDWKVQGVIFENVSGWKNDNRLLSSDSGSLYSADDGMNSSNSAAKVNYKDIGKVIDKRVEKKFEEFKILFSRDEYVDGEVSRTQLFFENLYRENKLVFERLFQKAWLHVFLDKKPSSLSDFILISASLDYSMLNENADVILVGSWSHKSLDVKDAILRAAESWQNPKHSAFLEQMVDIDDECLSEYKTRVMESLRGLV
ncbi:hypothetical protein [Aeromonas veronii]|uniref:hypothetical protein n=1 Tax=Aeromonas veronii TaxID=654 RepID=UPI0002808301|nr:hypothetical protein [Aeromonas veronii]EKB14486.1 hypothetical protein HMPREF1169_01764 [Aeromonas veronii AER397]